MVSFKKSNVTSDITSFDAPPTSSDTHPALRSSSTKPHVTQTINTGLTILSLCLALTIVGTSADTINVYNTTSTGEGGFLSMWPNEFDLRPTVALVICGSIILVSSTLSLIASRIQIIQNHTLLSLPLSLLFPSTSLIAALISTSFFYTLNSSGTNYTLQSWTCQWSAIDMNVKPYWGTLCRESKVALYLSVVQIVVQVLVLGCVVVGFLGRVRGWVGGREREGSFGGSTEEERKSPALS